MAFTSPVAPIAPPSRLMEAQKRLDLAPLIIRLAVVWVAAGALFKLFAGSPADLPPVVRDFPLGTDLTFKLAIAIELTIIFAGLLRPRLAWPMVLALFAVFEGVLVMVAMDGAESCGCFGSSITIPPSVMMGIDGVLIVLILLSKPWKSTARPLAPISVIALTTLLSFAAPFMIIGSQEIELPSDGEASLVPAKVEGIRYVEFDMPSWEGQMIYDIKLASLLGAEIDSVPIDATVVLYRGTCDHCAIHMEELAMNDDGSRPFIMIRIPDDGANEENTSVRTMPMGGHVTMLTLPEGPAYLIETPADFQLDGAVISAVREGIKVDEH